MSRFVAKISVCFQGFRNVAGRSARHGRNMISACVSHFVSRVVRQVDRQEFRSSSE
jgi:hypothetical protein